MTITTFLAIVLAVALGVALAVHLRTVLAFLFNVAWLFAAVGSLLAAIALIVILSVWPKEVRGLGLGYWYLAAIGVFFAVSLGAFKLREWYSHRCSVCRETLFIGEADPLDYYLAGHGGWAGDPLVVYVGRWWSLWRRQWYHQDCIGVYTDKIDRDGRWHIFGVPTKLRRALAHIEGSSETDVQ